MELGTSVNLGRRERLLIGALGCIGVISGSLLALWSGFPTPLRYVGGSGAALGVFLIGLATIWGVVASPIARSAGAASEPRRRSPPRVPRRRAIGPARNPELARRSERPR